MPEMVFFHDFAGKELPVRREDVLGGSKAVRGSWVRIRPNCYAFAKHTVGCDFDEILAAEDLAEVQALLSEADARRGR